MTAAVTPFRMAGKNRARNSVFIDKTREILTANPIQPAIADLHQTISATPTLAEVQAISDKVDSILAALRRAKIICGINPNDSQEDELVIPLTHPRKQKLILHLHKRDKEDGFGTFNNAYLPNAKDDFSDVRIMTDSGVVLPYRTTYYAPDFDIVPYNWTNKYKTSSAIFRDSKGNLYTVDRHIRMSTDKEKHLDRFTSFFGHGLDHL